MQNFHIEKLIQNLTIIFAKYLKIYQKIIDKKLFNSSVQSDPLNIKSLLLKSFNKLVSDPNLMLKYQMSFFKAQFETIELISQYYSNPSPENKSMLSVDKRFKDQHWEDSWIFSWIKQAYFTYSEWLEQIIVELPRAEFSSIELKRLKFITKQFINAVSPSNFIITNPEVLKSFFLTSGDNIIKGLDNLLHDIDKSKQGLNIKTIDQNQFELGVNIATTKGKVVFQNELIQLIHYNPLKTEYYSIPILVVPPFINKYYIMDLADDNSIISWLLNQNYNVFLISWVNPDETLADKNFNDYLQEGMLSAIDYLEKTLKFKQINAIGYCIGGTLLAVTLAYMKKNNDRRIKSASFITTLIDFTNAGDLSLFIDDNFIDKVSEYMKEAGGFLSGEDIATSFSLLKSNDMIWPFYINNYLLGRDPFPFNLLFWNADSTRIPMKLQQYYLKNMYLDNLLKEPNGLKLSDIPINVSEIDIPCFAIGAKGDHIVPWECAFNSAKLFSGPMEFILSDSGHVAGAMNHPDKNKYSYWINKKFVDYSSPDAWYNQVEEKAGSWWNYWNQWSKNYSGEIVKAKMPIEVNPIIIEDAPGSYVKKRYQD